MNNTIKRKINCFTVCARARNVNSNCRVVRGTSYSRRQRTMELGSHHICGVLPPEEFTRGQPICVAWKMFDLSQAPHKTPLIQRTNIRTICTADAMVSPSVWWQRTLITIVVSRRSMYWCRISAQSSLRVSVWLSLRYIIEEWNKGNEKKYRQYFVVRKWFFGATSAMMLVSLLGFYKRYFKGNLYLATVIIKW